MPGAPLDPLSAVLALEEARSRDEIFDLVTRAVRSRSAHVALLAVHVDSIRGKGDFEALGIARESVPVFETAIASRTAYVGPLPFPPLVGPSGNALVLPIAVGTRTVALVVAHREGTGGVSDLLPLVAASNLALTRVTAGRDRTHKFERATTAGYELEISYESGVAAKRATVARHRQQEAWAPLAEAMRELVREGMDGGDPDEDEQVDLMLQLARIEMDRLDKPELAIETYLRVLAWEPGHEAASQRLAALYEARGQWQPLAALLMDGATRADDPAAALESVAQLYQHKIGDAHATCSVMLEVLRRHPTRSGVLEELDRLVATTAVTDDLAAETAGLASELEAKHPAVAGGLWRLAGELHETHLGNVAEAIEAYEHARELSPDSAPVLIALHRGLLATEAWPALAEMLPSLIDALAPTAPIAVVVDLHVELGNVLVDQLARPDDAVRAFTDALALDPAHRIAFDGLTRAYQATGQTEALLDATESAIDLAGRSEQLERLPEIAIAWHDFGRFERAAACWLKLRALDPRGAAAGLVRALRAGEDWPALAEALRSQPPERTVLEELLGVLEQKLDDLEGACAVAAQLAALVPDHRGALESLARLHLHAGRSAAAIDALDQLLVLTHEPKARAEVLQRIGQAHLDERDATTARASLVEAIELDPKNARAREAMARVYLQQGELVAAGEALRLAADLSAKRDDMIRCLADAAWLYRHRLLDGDRARRLLQHILRIDPRHADAMQALSEVLLEAKEWQALWPHLEAQARDPNANAEILTKAARCAVELGRSVYAELYDRAIALDPSAALQVERAAALYRGKSLEAAATAYQAIAPGSLERAQLLDVYRRLAQIHTELGRADKAQIFHQKVLDIDPAHRETLSELAELHLARDRYDDAIASLRGLAAISEKAERIGLLERIGDLYRHQLANSGRASSAYLEALELDSGNRRILQRLLDLQTETGQWRLAVKTIERFLEHEDDPVRRGAYYLAAAEIWRTELKDQERALDCYESGVDMLLSETPIRSASRARALDAFHGIERRAISDGNWTSLERSYRRMIVRLRGTEDPLLITLWDELGEVYRAHLGLAEAAISALETAHSLDPDKSSRRRRILVGLYAQIGSKRPDTVSEVTPLPAPPPQPPAPVVEIEAEDRPAAFRAIAVASLAEGRIDEAWCVCRALVILKAATAKETEFYKRYQAEEVRKAPGIIDEETWALLRHPDEDRVISAIFALIWEHLAALRAGSPQSFELRPKDRIPVETDTRVVAKIFRHASRLLNVPLRDVYAQPRRSGRLLLANCIEKGRLAPAVIVGRDLMTGYRDTEIAAAVGSMIALMRPGYYLRLTLPTIEELEAALVAAAQLVGRTIGREVLAPLTEVFAPRLGKVLTRPIAETLLAFANHLPDKPDLARWRNAVDATSHRAGLVVSGELAATIRMIASGQRGTDLIDYSVSANYFALRRHLGINL